MFEATVELGAVHDDVVPATILGHNLEATEKNVAGMLTNRLANPKLVGPADANGLAPPWRASLDFFQGARAELDPGVSLAGNGSSQLLLSYGSVGAIAQSMMQTHRPIRAGERLEVVLWAKARHRPARLELALRPVELPRGPYAREAVVVDSPHWKRYAVMLDVPADDENAVFACAIVGEGLVWIDQLQLRPVDEGHVSRAMLDRIATLDVPVLRFPGGCLASNYRWRNGTGPVELRPATLDTANHRALNYDFGTDEYLELCHAQGIRPHLTVNIGTGTPEEAAAWAAYVADWHRARDVEPPVAYFQVGNEDNAVHEHSHMTPAMYADVLRAYVPALRAAYPAARIVAMAEQHGMTLTRDDAPWREPVLAVARELAIDVLVVHIYCWSAAADEQGELAQAVAGAREARAELERFVADCRAAGVDCRIGVTEWNFWTSASHWDGPTAYERSGASMQEPYRATHGLYAAGMLHAFAALAPDLELANFYQLVNGMGVFEHRGIDVHDGPMADLFRLYRPAFPARRCELRCEGPAVPDGTDAALDALALAQDDATWLFLVNRRADAPAAVAVRGVDGAPEVAALAAERPHAPLAPAAAPAWEDGRLVLPPLSIARLRWPA
ncbi:MAG: hypothetical protein ACTHOE_13695 [Conexibacter sp.]